jgi:hypothetical protein
VEIDEYRNYEKAAAALKEALKHATKIKSEIKDARVASLEGMKPPHFVNNLFCVVVIS